VTPCVATLFGAGLADAAPAVKDLVDYLGRRTKALARLAVDDVNSWVRLNCFAFRTETAQCFFGCSVSRVWEHPVITPTNTPPER